MAPKAPRPSLPGLCSAPPLRPSARPQESTASHSLPLCGTSPYVPSGPDTWPSSPHAHPRDPSTAPPLPGPSPAPVSTSSRLQPGRATDTCSPQLVPNHVAALPKSHPDNALRASACSALCPHQCQLQPWLCSASQDFSAHLPARQGILKAAFKVPLHLGLAPRSLTQRAKPRSSQEPGLHPSRANSTNCHRPYHWRPQPAESLCLALSSCPRGHGQPEAHTLRMTRSAPRAQGSVQDLGVAGCEMAKEAQVWAAPCSGSLGSSCCPFRSASGSMVPGQAGETRGGTGASAGEGGRGASKQVQASNDWHGVGVHGPDQGGVSEPDLGQA